MHAISPRVQQILIMCSPFLHCLHAKRFCCLAVHLSTSYTCRYWSSADLFQHDKQFMKVCVGLQVRHQGLPHFLMSENSSLHEGRPLKGKVLWVREGMCGFVPHCWTTVHKDCLELCIILIFFPKRNLWLRKNCPNVQIQGQLTLNT